ncbi:hypothetical protein LRS03_01110 [Rhizobacter sp. J219]|uniref:hypothetical protein n=1 Tax=Rhizobacter sp. J219 TaxID=2898430 RepID=UPI0021511854|nr:hypothetical protein [Rhizobacter sp. J219]MCR5881540.1 hypothetical protein [Rhizobacter sp. J219]
MATSTVKTPAEPKVKKPAPSLVERTKAQLAAAALRGKVTADELEALAAHIAKLKALVA